MGGCMSTPKADDAGPGPTQQPAAKHIAGVGLPASQQEPAPTGSEQVVPEVPGDAAASKVVEVPQQNGKHAVVVPPGGHQADQVHQQVKELQGVAATGPGSSGPSSSIDPEDLGRHAPGQVVPPAIDAAEPATTQHMPPLSAPTDISHPAPLSNLSSRTSHDGESNPLAQRNTWDKAKLLFQLTKAEELFNDLHDLKYIGAGGYGKVFKAVWRSAPVAVKLVPSNSPELFKSSSYKEALLCKELCHPNIVQTYETRCAQLSEEFVRSILTATEVPVAQQQKMWGAANQQGGGGGMPGYPGGQQSYGSQEFVSGDGFGLPSPVPDMVGGKALPEAAAKWKDILYTTGAKAGDYLTVIIMDFCDYGSLVRPIMKGMFRPFSATGSDREARVRYRALLRTAKEIAQGLEHLHHLRVVHGDLKPGNVLLKGSRVDVRGFNAQVIDFGLSHLVSNSNPQKVSKAGGTLVYAAPEVFSGKVGKAADVYSLGIILWEMVTGSQPYKDLVEGQIVLGVQKGGLRPQWPLGQLPQLQELYTKCVAQDPEERPKAKEVVGMLTQIEMDLRSELKAAHKQQQQAVGGPSQGGGGPPQMMGGGPPNAMGGGGGGGPMAAGGAARAAAGPAAPVMNGNAAPQPAANGVAPAAAAAAALAAVAQQQQQQQGGIGVGGGGVPVAVGANGNNRY